jgi:hypothetical protein
VLGVVEIIIGLGLLLDRIERRPRRRTREES